jgi:hypothetical protein
VECRGNREGERRGRVQVRLIDQSFDFLPSCPSFSLSTHLFNSVTTLFHPLIIPRYPPFSIETHLVTYLSLHYRPSSPPHRALAEGELLATNLTRKEVHDLQKWYRVERVRRHRERRRR